MTSTPIPIQNISGVALKEIISGGSEIVNKRQEGGGSTHIADRIAELSVPTGLVYIPEKTNHTLQYRSSKPYYTYETISEELYDKLLDLVSVHPTSNKRPSSRSRKPKIKGSKSTRKNA
jgi:hypothetical protein